MVGGRETVGREAPGIDRKNMSTKLYTVNAHLDRRETAPMRSAQADAASAGAGARAAANARTAPASPARMQSGTPTPA